MIEKVSSQLDSVNFIQNRINIKQTNTRTGNIIEGEHWDSDSK